MRASRCLIAQRQARVSKPSRRFASAAFERRPEDGPPRSSGVTERPERLAIDTRALPAPSSVRLSTLELIPPRLLVMAIILAGAGCSKSHAAKEAEGKTLFVNACARCHGVEGTGGLPLFDGGPSPRNFRDHAFHESHTDEQIRMTVKNGKGTGMPPFVDTFTGDQLAAIVAHLRTLDSGRGRSE